MHGASHPTFSRLRGETPSGCARGQGEWAGKGVSAMGNRWTLPRDTTSPPELVEQAAKTCEPGEGTEPVARLCGLRNEKEP